MADKFKAWPQNAKGRFYVDEGCIACDNCCAIAPVNFKMHKDGHSVLVKQPENPAELKACLEAKEHCPVESIGDDREAASEAEKSA